MNERRSSNVLRGLGAALLAGAALGGACKPSGDAPAAIVAAPSTIHRLTQAQYTNALHDLLGASVMVTEALEPDLVVDGFATVGGSVGGVSRRGIEQYETSALSVAAQALAAGPARDALVGCTPGGVDDAICGGFFLSRLGRKAWRRPLASDELGRITGVFQNAGRTLGDFYQGLAYGVAALLESPNFLYRVELGTPDPAHPGTLRYQGFELASRLSFFLWNTLPDDALLDAAAGGALDTDAGLEAQVDRLLASPRAHDAMKNFFTERLGLTQLYGVSKDATVFPEMTTDFPAVANQETLTLIDELLMVENADYRELFTTRRTFVDTELAALYGVPAPSKTTFAETTLPENGLRRGLLGHASLLAIYSHPTSTSPTLRGRFVREVLLCQAIPDPPASVNTALPDPTASGPTLRDRLQAHVAIPFCASCHTKMDPIGFGLESFDGMGKLRTTDNGAPVDASGNLDGAAFTTPIDLGADLAAHPALGPCLVRHVVRYASAAPETPGEDPEIDRLAGDFAAQGNGLVGLLRAVVMSPVFRTATENP
jgi:hypothetical protein